MSLAEIKNAVRELSPAELAELTAFLVAQDNAHWDRQIEADAKAGKLDGLFDEAEQERTADRLRDWPPE